MSFSEEKVAERLTKLNPTEASIVSTSQWLLFHYRNAKTIVDIWNAKFQNPAVSSNDKLTLYYLSNDLIQSARKNPKHLIFLKEFTETLPESLKVVSKSIDEPIKQKFKKVIKIWQDRQVFSQRVIDGFMASIDAGSKSSSSMATSRANAEPGTLLEVQKKIPKKDVDDYDPEKEVAPELMPVNMIFNTISQASLDTSTEFQVMSKKYSSLFKAEHLPAPHKFIKELNDLVHRNNKLVDSTNNLTKMRTDLISNLQKLLDRQKEWLKLEELRLQKLDEMKQNVVDKKVELEELIKDVASTTEDTSINDSKVTQDDDDEDMPTYVYDDEAEKNEASNDADDNEIAMPSYTTEKEDDDDEMPGYKHDDGAGEENEEPSPAVDTFSSDEKEDDESSFPPKKKVRYSEVDKDDGYDPTGSTDDQQVPENTDLASILFKLT